MFRKNKKQINNLKKGFTLVELLVTLSIFVIVTGVVLFSQNKFNSSIVLTNLSYDMALMIRQAQTFGMGGKSSGFPTDSTDPSVSVVKPTYGVHLETTAANNKTVISFADYDGSRTLTLPSGTTMATVCSRPGTECLEKSLLTRGNRIAKICSLSSNNVDTTFIKNCTGMDTLDITFRRPKAQPLVIANGTDILDSGVLIILASEDGSVRSVSVGILGNINIIR